METIQATGNLVIELHPGEEACLIIKLRDSAGESQEVSISPSQVGALREALARGAALLAVGEAGDREDEEMTLRQAADLFSLDYSTLAQAAFAGRLAARRSGFTWLTTRWAVRDAIVKGRLTLG